MAPTKPELPAPEAAGKCPICSARSEPHYRPFCSRRCADVDLSRWLRGAYAIPVAEADDEDGASAEEPANAGEEEDDAAGRKR